MTVVYAPIAFEMTFTPARSSKERTVSVRDKEPVMVRDVEGKSAPVAVRAALVDGKSTKKVDYRYFDGKLWEPAATYEVDKEAPVAADFKGNPFVVDGSAFLGKDMPPLLESVTINEKKPHSNQRSSASAALQDLANSMILVDGTLFVHSVGPVIALKLAPGGREGSFVLTSVDDLDKEIVDSMIFRADEKDVALRATDGLLGKRAVTVDFEKPQILIPEALTADITGEAIKRTAHRVFKRDADSVGIGNLSTPFLRLFLKYINKDFDRSTPSSDLVDIAVTGGEMLKDVRECGTVSKTAGWLPRRIEAVDYAFASSTPNP